MKYKFVLNLNQQTNGDYEVHKAGCEYLLTSNYVELGDFSYCSSAVTESKLKHPFKKINGCFYCAKDCNTSL